jgi:hypothetical protein
MVKTPEIPAGLAELGLNITAGHLIVPVISVTTTRVVSTTW